RESKSAVGPGGRVALSGDLLLSYRLRPGNRVLLSRKRQDHFAISSLAACSVGRGSRLRDAAPACGTSASVSGAPPRASPSAPPRGGSRGTRAPPRSALPATRSWCPPR